MRQARFDAVVATFDTERPHEGPPRRPGRAPRRLPAPFPGLPELACPLHDRDLVVARNGTIACTGARPSSRPPSRARRLGLREADADVRLVSFMRCDLGCIDLEARTLQTIDAPFGSRASPMRSARTVTYVTGLVSGRGSSRRVHIKSMDVNGL